MKKTKNRLFLFIASIICGILISVNFNLENIRTYTQLNSSEYQNAVEERTRLHKEVENLKDINEETTNKIEKYHNEGEKNEEIVADMKKQISNYNLFTGLSEVEGSGIVITLNDGTTDVKTQSFAEIMSKLLHDDDLGLILNELRGAGAEAISVNNHRVIPSSGAVCAWAFIQFEDGSMESAPFKIYAIGDPEKLKAALFQEGSHLNKLIIKKIYVDIEEKENIKMPATKQIIQTSYMEREENNTKNN